MNINDRLKEFYLLEAFQVQLYQSWVDSAQSEYLKNVYQHMAEIEQKHVEFFAQRIEDAGLKVPTISGGLTALAGRVWGEVLDLTKEENCYRMGIFAESKAMEMYDAFILEAWQNPDLCKELWRQMIDEEYHLLWFKKHLGHD